MGATARQAGDSAEAVPSVVISVSETRSMHVYRFPLVARMRTMDMCVQIATPMYTILRWHHVELLEDQVVGVQQLQCMLADIQEWT